MNLTVSASIPAITVFLQGILSFFSPCVFPLVPLYVSYLAGGARTVREDGTVEYPKKTVLLNTVFFVIGISFTFFLLGLGFTSLGHFFNQNKLLFTRVSGIIMVLFGLFQFGFFGREGALSQEKRLPFRLDKWAMNPLVAFVLGFTFSFAWTPCVGPALSGVLLMASSAASAGTGFLLIGVYTLGFVLPFLAVGLFTGAVLGFFKKHKNVVKYTVKVGAALLILMGIMTFTGYMNGISSYLSRFTPGAAPAATVSPVPSTAPESAVPPPESASPTAAGTETPAPETTAPTAVPESAEPSATLPAAVPPASEIPSADPAPSEEPEAVPAPDFTLTDQNGVEHTLSDYKGKVVFLNFWATWCGPCKKEMPHIQELYENYGKNEEDLIVLTLANPKTDEYPRNNDGTVEEVEQFLTDNEYTFPALMDTTGEAFAAYGISAFPTTFMIDARGSVFGYVRGQLTYDMMENIIQQTVDGKST